MLPVISIPRTFLLCYFSFHVQANGTPTSCSEEPTQTSVYILISALTSMSEYLYLHIRFLFTYSIHCNFLRADVCVWVCMCVCAFVGIYVCLSVSEWCRMTNCNHHCSAVCLTLGICLLLIASSASCVTAPRQRIARFTGEGICVCVLGGIAMVCDCQLKANTR